MKVLNDQIAYQDEYKIAMHEQQFLEKILEKVADFYQRQERYTDAISTLEKLLESRESCQNKSWRQTA